VRKLHFILFVLLVGAGHLFGQEHPVDGQDMTDEKRSPLILKADLFMPIWMGRFQYYTFALTAEHPIARRHSIQLTYQDGRTNFVGTNYRVREHASIFIPEYKFFVKKRKQCSGYYAGVSALYLHGRDIGDRRYGTGSWESFSEPYKVLGFGLINGVQLYFFEHLTVDALAGVLLVNDLPDKGYGWYPFPRVALNIGYRF